MIIRHATITDIPAMLPLINLAFEVETFIAGPRTTEAELQAMLGTGEFLLADDDGSIAASVYTELRGEFPGRRGYFAMLAVSPTRQGMGLGRTIINAAEQHCRTKGCTHMDITVLTLRTELPPFYRKLGYVQTGMKAFATKQALKDGLACACIIRSKEL